MVGGVRSMLMLLSVALAKFPALSRQFPVTDCPAPSPRVVGNELLETPDKGSEQAKLTVTWALFHPLLPARGDLELVIMGGVRSILIPPSVVLTEFPARSVQFPVTDWPAPSPRVVGDEALETPDNASEHVKLTVTWALFQPFALG